MKKRLVAGIILTLILTFILTLVPALGCPAVFAFDPAATDGKITLVLKDTDATAVTSGLRIGLYKVGEVLMADATGAPVYKATDAFVSSGADLVIVSDEDMREQAEILAAYVKSRDIDPLREGQATRDNGGVIEFTGLESGIYLVSQLGVAAGEGGIRRTMTSFLIRIPDFNETAKIWTNEVAARPKISKRTPGEPPDEPPDEPPYVPPYVPPYTPPVIAPEKKADIIEIKEQGVPVRDWPGNDEIWIPEDLVPLGALPRTGLLRWPIPIMSVSGALSTICGIVVIKRSKKEDADED